MSYQAMDELMRRADTDPAFRELLLKCPAAGLGGYSLTPAEKAALFTGDQQQLEALGISQSAARDWTGLDGLT